VDEVLERAGLDESAIARESTEGAAQIQRGDGRNPTGRP